MAVYSNALDLIGNTPIVEVKCFDTNGSSLFVKLENQNPGGSIKDRIALFMIQAAEREGKLKPGGTILEATAGNTGIGLALVAKLKGYQLKLVIPDKMSREKIQHLRALGAECIITRTDVMKGDPEYYQDMAERIANETGAYYVNQFNNPANPLAHESGTGPEIWSQMNHNLDAVVVGVGSSGTLTGLSRFFSKVAPHVQMVLADPAGSVLKEFVDTGKITKEAGSWLVEGIGEDFIPPIADFSRCKHAYSITDEESFFYGRELLAKEGILAGSSSGTLVASALQYCKAQTSPKRVLTFICDNGNKYLSKMYNDYWMRDQGFIKRVAKGNLEDLISRKKEEGSVVSVAPTDNLNTAYGRMKLYDVSQLPVLENDKIVGIIDESDILLTVFGGDQKFSTKVSAVMTTNLKTVSPATSLEEAMEFFKKGLVVIVENKGTFLGLITQIDVLNFLRNRNLAKS